MTARYVITVVCVMIRLVNVSVHQDSVVNAVQRVSELPLCYTVYTVKHKEKLRFF